ncbi:MAG: hypothetical protein ACMUJM_23445 [bacterium]
MVYLIFGIKNSPRFLIGLNQSSLKQFEKIDPEKISEYLLEIFSSDIRWEQYITEISQKRFGIFYIYEALTKPIIAKKDEGKGQIIKKWRNILSIWRENPKNTICGARKYYK